MCARGTTVATLVASVQDALLRTGARRTEADNHVIELVLALFRNLLAIDEDPYTDGAAHN